MPETSYSTRLQSLAPCDVLVAGGGLAGVFAALAARRQGADTVLIEQHAFVGGQGTAGGVHSFCGDTRLVNAPWHQMIARLESFGAISGYRPNADARSFKGEYLKFVLQEMLAEAGVRVLLHTQLIDVLREGGTCRGVVVHNKSGLQYLACGQIIDATGEADVLAKGGWAWDRGGPAFIPAVDPTQELKLDTSSMLQLPMSLYFTMLNTGRPVHPVLPAGCPAWETDAELPMTSISGDDTCISVKMKVIGHDATNGESLSQAEQHARRQMMGLVYHLQTKGYHGKVYSTYRLEWVAPHIGIREGRRVRSRYRLSAQDILAGRHFPDAVAVGSYHVDYHWPTVLQRAGTGLTTQCPPYQIPLSAMRPINSDNVLVPGRGLGGDQMAMSSFRVMATCAQTGFAAGTAAGLAARRGQQLDGMSPEEVRARLRAEGARFDLAPYTNYLRASRGLREPVFLQAAGFRECHASTIVIMPNGDAVCAWFGGTREGATDVAIWGAIRREERWGEPFEIARHPGEPSWNPVLFLPDTSRLFPSETVTVTETDSPPALYLFYRVGLTIPAWRSYMKMSTDGGLSWREPQPLPEGLLGPIKNKPIVLKNGTWLAGSSVETSAEWYCRMERSTDGGKTWIASEKIALPGHPKGLIQPTLWESTPGHVHALLRSRGVGLICRADSSDGGETWCTPYKTDLPHPNSGIDLTKLVPSPGDPGYGEGPVPLALVYNPVEQGRTPLVVALSYDNGHTWSEGVTLEDTPGEYSYPAIVPTADGVALCYTYRRERIEFARLSWEHLRGSEALPGRDTPTPGWLKEVQSHR